MSWRRGCLPGPAGPAQPPREPALPPSLFWKEEQGLRAGPGPRTSEVPGAYLGSFLVCFVFFLLYTFLI